MAGELTSFWLARGRGVIDTGLTPNKGAGVPALAWRFDDNTPVLKAEGGYWLRSA